MINIDAIIGLLVGFLFGGFSGVILTCLIAINRSTNNDSNKC